MGGWRRQKGYNYCYDTPRTKSKNRRVTTGNWKPFVPSWEKQFCTSTCLMSWEKIMEAKNFTHLFENIVKWNDSAGEEAFHNAKKLFYARMHGLPCDVCLPDPDKYIDKVDWDAQIDPQLLMDLECKATLPNSNEQDECVIIFGDYFPSSQGFSAAGWGDGEEEFKKASNAAQTSNRWDHQCSQNERAALVNGWGDSHNFQNHCYEGNEAKGNNDWEDGWNHRPQDHDWHGLDDMNAQGCVYANKMSPHGCVRWKGNGGKRGYIARFESSNKTPGNHGDNHWRNKYGRNGNTRLDNFAHKQQLVTDRSQSSRHWNLYSVSPQQSFQSTL